MHELELMRQVQDGDEMAFREIIRIYKDRIVNYLCQLVGDYQRAVELSQETFMRVYFRANQYRPIAPLSSWIYTIASNLAKTELKKMRRVSIVSLDDIQNSPQLEAPANNPADASLIRNLRKALNSLHPRYRIPIILKDIEGFSQEEIAQILKKPIGTVKARISRGREHLKREFKKASHKGKLFASDKEYQDG